MPELKLFNPETAAHEDFVKTNKFANERQVEERPDDPPVSVETSIKRLQGWKHLESIKIEYWQLHLDDQIVAAILLSADDDENNNHLFHFTLHVLAPHRGKGYTKLLLPKLIAFADKHKRRLGQSFTSSRIPAGQEFAEYLNATKGLTASINQLVLKNLDDNLLQEWLTPSQAVKAEFEMASWGNVYPEEEIQAITELIDVMNTAPREDLEMEDSKTTPAELREQEAYFESQKIKRIVLYVRHKKSGELAGYTETLWSPDQPDVIGQEGTGVLPKYRGNKLGKWLKAAMVQRIVAEQPDVKFIRTGNAASNEHMLAINHALGFELYESNIVWQIEADKIRAYLQ